MSRLSKHISRMNILHHGEGTVFGDVVYGPKGVCGPRRQRDYQIVALHSGSFSLHWDHRVMEVEPGQSILLPPGHTECFSFSEQVETHHAWCSISPSQVPPTLRHAIGDEILLRRWTRPFDELFRLSTRNTRVDVTQGLRCELLRSYAVALLAEFVAGEDSVDMRHHPAVSRVEAYVRENYTQPLDLRSLARVAGLSPQHLLKVFRDADLPSPMQVLWNHRLETAADLLNHTGLSVAEVSDRCGFSNPFHFSRRFKQRFDLSLRAYRTHAWGNSLS